MPTDSRTRFGGTSSGEPATDAWVIAPGCSMRLSTAPSDSASVNTRVAAATCLRRGFAGRQREAHHPAVVAHLLGRRGVAGMIGQLRVEHALDGRVAGEQIDDRPGVLAVPVHPHAERLHAAQHEVAVERRRHRAGRVLREAQAFGEPVVVDGDEPADDVAVTTEVLRRRVHDDIGAERDRLLQVRRGERVVDDDEGAPAMGDRRRSPRCRCT